MFRSTTRGPNIFSSKTTLKAANHLLSRTEDLGLSLSLIQAPHKRCSALLFHPKLLLRVGQGPETGAKILSLNASFAKHCTLWLGVWGLGFEAWGSGRRAWGLRLMIWGLGFGEFAT